MASKCIIILSTKSSGSSACQRFISSTGNVNHVAKTRHFQNETLYWTKAASILGLPQIRVLDSEVPFEKSKAKAELLQLLYDNLDSYSPPAENETLVFDGWRKLCLRCGPVFLEKSPHHLVQWSNLELIRRAMQALPDVEFHIVGLVRNPMDTLYSAWRRWRTSPEKNQYQWLVAYSNLLRLKCLLGDKVSIVRYEDMVSNPNALAREFAFVGATDVDVAKNYFYQSSINRWRQDKLFGFVLSDEVVDLGRQYGYSSESMTNSKLRVWLPYRLLVRTQYLSTLPVRNVARRLRERRLRERVA